LKKAKSHFEAAAMAGHEVARCNIGTMENNSGNMGQAVNMGRAMKHWTIAASAGYYTAMHYLLFVFNQGHVSRETLTAYNNSCPR
jgi:TPR repeat protein